MSTVLIVDDDVSSCNALARLLSLAGHDAACVPGGNEALAFLKSIRADLVLLDVMMPGMSGIEVLRRLRADPTAAPRVVMYSAKSDPETIAEAAKLGAADYLVKTQLTWPELRARINQLVQGTGPVQ